MNFSVLARSGSFRYLCTAAIFALVITISKRSTRVTTMNRTCSALLAFHFIFLFSNAQARNGDSNDTKITIVEKEASIRNLHGDAHEIDYAKQDEAVRNLLKWSIEQGGYMHPHVKIRRSDPSDPTSYFGAFVSGPVNKDELLLKIPGSTKIQIDDFFRTGRFSYSEVICELAWTLEREYNLDKDSKYAPYIEYLHTQSKHQIPAMWTDEGKNLITKVQGDLSMVNFDTMPVPGEHMHDWIDDYFGGELCLVDDETWEELDEWFVAIATQRGFDFCLIP